MIEDMNDNQIVNVLQSQLIAHLACYADKKLFLVPITYAYKDGYLYCQSKDGLKIQLMRKNPAVCIEVDQIESMRNWRTVILWGEYEQLKNEKDKAKAQQILMDRIEPIYTGETVIPQILEDYPEPFRIKINKQTGRYEKPS